MSDTSEARREREIAMFRKLYREAVADCAPAELDKIIESERSEVAHFRKGVVGGILRVAHELFGVLGVDAIRRDKDELEAAADELEAAADELEAELDRRGA